MSIREDIVSLEELSVLDEEIRCIDDRLNSDRGVLAGKREELLGLEERIVSDSRIIEDTQKARLELVAEVRQVSVQLDKSREKLSKARNERETNAVTRELEELRRIQKEREEEIGKLQLVETHAMKSKEDAEAARSVILEQMGQTEGAISQRLGDTEVRRAELARLRDVVVARLSRVLLSRYEQIRKRRGVAIAATSDGICQACYVAVPPQLFQKILRFESLEKCPHCQRILYYRPSAIEESAEE